MTNPLPPGYTDLPMGKVMEITGSLSSTLLKSIGEKGVQASTCILVLEAQPEYGEADEADWQDFKASGQRVPPGLADRRRGFRIVKAWESPRGDSAGGTLPAGLPVKDLVARASRTPAAVIIVLDRHNPTTGGRTLITDVHHWEGLRMALKAHYLESGDSRPDLTVPTWCHPSTLAGVLPAQHILYTGDHP